MKYETIIQTGIIVKNDVIHYRALCLLAEILINNISF